MAFTLPALQTKTSSKTATAGTTSTVVLSTTTTGSTVVVVVCSTKGVALGGVTGISCTGMTFTQVDEQPEGGTGTVADGAFWKAENITGAVTPTLTVTYTAALLGGAIIREYASTTPGSIDQHIAAKNVGAAGTALSSGASPAQVGTNDLVIGWGVTGDGGNVYTAGATYGNATSLSIGGAIDMALEDKVLSGSTAAQTATFSVSAVANWGCGVATFKEAAVVATASPGYQVLARPGFLS